ncbi:MAG: DNA alkylation repair protein [Candidatus Pacearchaeota archaeon]|jgi:3-methyladenine DNA glycosylase AlkD
MINELEKRLKEKENKEKAKVLQGFFKTEKGEYGEGDIFLGIVVPEQRKIAKEFKHLDLKEIKELLDSKIHEKRLISLLILIEKYEIYEDKKEIFDFYIKNTQKINNWDLVDLSAPQIVGNYLKDKNRKILYDLVKSENLWEKRIGIISTLTFIRNYEYIDTINLAEILLNDKHDLIQKAVGWMLREVGKKDEPVLENFLKIHYKVMPRTMLRYAIERFEESKRKKYLKGEI